MLLGSLDLDPLRLVALVQRLGELVLDRLLDALTNLDRFYGL